MDDEREVATVSFTINGDFIANAIESYSKMTEDISEHQQLRFQALLDEGVTWGTETSKYPEEKKSKRFRK